MIVDPSAIIAILTGEEEREQFFNLLMKADAVHLSAASRVELTAVIVRKRLAAGEQRLTDLFDACDIAIVPFTVAHAELASDAYRRFGRGSGHAARLNLGDCFSYALARERDAPLLFTGDDFRHTDVRVAA